MTITFKRVVFVLVCFCSYKVSFGAIKVEMLIMVAEFIVCLFCVDALLLSQQFFSDFGRFCCLAELSQYLMQRIKCLAQQPNTVPLMSPNQGPLNLKSNTLPLSHHTPLVEFQAN